MILPTTKSVQKGGFHGSTKETRSQFHGQSPKKSVPRVNVQAVQMISAASQEKYVGHIEAIESIELQARVRCYLNKASFFEGSFVEKGDLIYVIEQASYQAPEFRPHRPDWRKRRRPCSKRRRDCAAFAWTGPKMFPKPSSTMPRRTRNQPSAHCRRPRQIFDSREST